MRIPMSPEPVEGRFSTQNDQSSIAGMLNLAVVAGSRETAFRQAQRSSVAESMSPEPVEAMSPEPVEGRFSTQNDQSSIAGVLNLAVVAGEPGDRVSTGSTLIGGSTLID
jgi:hypothetical protein